MIITLNLYSFGELEVDIVSDGRQRCVLHVTVGEEGDSQHGLQVGGCALDHRAHGGRHIHHNQPCHALSLQHTPGLSRLSLKTEHQLFFLVTSL